MTIFFLHYYKKFFTTGIEAAPPNDYDFYTNDEDPTFCGRNEYYTRSAAVSQPTCQDPELSFSIRVRNIFCVLFLYFYVLLHEFNDCFLYFRLVYQAACATKATLGILSGFALEKKIVPS